MHSIIERILNAHCHEMHLNHRCGRYHWLNLIDGIDRNVHAHRTIGVNGSAVARNMACLTTFVAHLTNRVERATIRSRTVTRDMTLP